MENQFKKIGAFIATLIIISFGLYFSIFHGTLSTNPSDWGSFGSYFSGVALSILTLLNIYVIILLGKQTSKADKERINNTKELQRKILLTKFRQLEITKLSEILDTLILKMTEPALAEDNVDKVKRKTKYKIVEVRLQMDSFLNQKGHLFPFQDIVGLELKYNELFDKLSDLKTFHYNILDKKDGGDDRLLIDFLNLKNEVISMMQTFTLQELD